MTAGPCPVTDQELVQELQTAWAPYEAALRTAVADREGAFEIWLASLHLHDTPQLGGELVLGVAAHLESWMNGHFHRVIAACIAHITADPWRLEPCERPEPRR